MWARSMPRRVLLVLLVLLAAGIRITYAVTTGHASTMTPIEGQIAHDIVADGRWFVGNKLAHYEGVPGHGHELIDPASLDLTSADRHGQWYPAITHPIGTGVVIAGLWALTGSERYIQIEVLQALLDAVVVLLVYWIAMQLFDRAFPAMLAAGMYAIYPPIAWDTADPYDDIWAVDFTIAIVAAYLMMMRSGHRWRWLLGCGVLSGLGAYFRPQVILIVPVLAVVTVPATGWREALRRALTTALVVSILLAPWTVRNYEDFHAFIPIRSGLWETMVGGLAELPVGGFASIEGPAHRAHPHLQVESPAWDAVLKPYFIRAVEQHPLDYLEVLAHRVLLATVLMHETIWMRRGAGAVLDASGGVFAFAVEHPFELLEYALQPLVFVLAMLGLALTWRRWKRQNTMLVAIALCVLAPYIAMHVEGRYLLPACFVYFIWIGLGAELAVQRVKRRSSVPLRRPRIGALVGDRSG